MKRLWCMLLVAAFSFCCVGCGPSAVQETETEAELEEDLESQEEMMEEMDAEAPAE
jgi:hypothetical protein